eukprot:8717723-Pyramimonas_sp.AAC.1
MGAPKLSLTRIGWHVPSFTTVVDHKGAEHPLTLIPPALLMRHLRLAIQAHHERRSGTQLLSHLPRPVRVRRDK